MSTTTLPLSPGQRGLWFLYRLHPDSTAYHLALASRIRSAMPAEAIRDLFQAQVDRHEALRTTFPLEGDEPVQRVADRAELAFEEIDATGWDEAAFQVRLEAEAWKPFDLERGPLFRVQIFHRTSERVLLVVVHHIVVDFGSFAGLLSGAGGEAPQYRDFLRWQAEMLEGAEGEALWSFWRERLAGLPILELPTDRPRRTGGSERGGCRWREVDPEVVRPLKALARSQGGTLYVALLAGFQALLSRYTGQTDFAVGSPAAGRPKGFARAMGYFTNPLPVRADLSGAPSFRELLGRARERVSEALDHQHLPLPVIVERRREGAPFRTLFVFHRDPSGLEGMVGFALGEGGGLLRWGGLELEPLALPLRAAQFDVSLAAGERRGALGLQIVYDTDLFDAPTAARWLEHLAVLFESAAVHPDVPITELPLLTARERQQVLIEVNDPGEVDLPWKRLEEGFERQAERTPEAVAVIDGERRITYRELLDRATALAQHLSRLKGQVVGVKMPRTAELVASLLGVLKAGATYLPLDPSYPEERINFLLEDAGTCYTLQSINDVPPLPVEGGRRERGSGGEVAYLIYTSGSTGRPKGVAIEHASAVRLVAWAGQTYSPEELSGVLASTSINFDLSIFEIFVPLSFGGTVILAENALALPTLPAAGELTLINTVPSAIAALLDLGPLPPKVRTVNLAGEPLRRSLAERVLAKGVKLWDLYGPSEDTTYSTGAEIRAGDPDEPAIGWPVAGSRAYVVDANLHPLPVGVPGELCLGGGGLARGYLGRPDLTAEKFVPDPFSGGRLYRTGDLARRRPDGALEYLGRLDHQVKIRGFRIEPGEIEAALLAHPGVREAVVVAREGALAAYVSLTAEMPDLAAWLRSRLPAPFVPSAFVVLPALPLTPNGKVDRKALPAPEWKQEIFDEPAGSVEETLAEIWAEVLGLDRIGRHQSFFELGGHSLLAVRVLSRISRRFGVDLPVGTLFEAPTLAALAGRIGTGSAAKPVRPVLVPHEGREDLPLSFAQQRLWFLDQLQPGSAAYNMPGAAFLEGPLSQDALAASVAALVERHEALRTRFSEREGHPVQIIDPPQAVPLPVLDLSEDEAFALIRREAARPFDLGRGPLLRAGLVRLGPDRHLLWLVLHHIIADGWSLGVLMSDLAALYAGATLPGLPVEYADYAAWQREQPLDLDWWKQRLAGVPETLELPADRPRPAIRTQRGFQVRTWLPAAPALRGATLFQGLLAAFQAFLLRITGQDDLVVGSAVANRNRPEVEGLIGLFANTLVLRNDLSGDPSFAEALARTRESTLSTFAHQDVPIEKLVEELHPGRELGQNPLFQVAIVLQNAPVPLALPGLVLRRVPVETETAKFDLTLELTESEEGLSAVWELSRDLFEPATGRRMAAHFENLLQGAVIAPERRISDLPLLSEEERRQLLVGWNPAPTTAPIDMPVHRLFEEQARSWPDRIALVAGDLELTYGELDARADSLARHLEGLRPEALVGVLLERSPEMIEAFLAVLKAGGAYVPLDPSWPEERLAGLIDEAGIGIVVPARTIPKRDAGGTPALPGLAYAMFTSGSTGRPKTVGVEHRSIVRLVRGGDWADLGSDQVFLQLAPPAFDAATLEIWGALANGGRLVLYPPGVPSVEDLGAALERHGVTTLWLTAGLFHQVVESRIGILRGVRQLLAGGDVLSPEAVHRVVAELPGCRMVNGYGPTENTTFTCCYEVREPLPGRTVPIGRPIPGTTVYVLDPYLQPVPELVPGELLAGGEGLARGYLGRPDLTAERFVPSPFEPGARLYRTGDRVRWLPGGELEFLGRLDRQVKIRGFRVEPGEVEAVLARHPGVAQAAVLVVGEASDRRLVGCVVPAGEDLSGLRDWLAARLPAYLVPALVTLPELPLTPNGKVDRAALLGRLPESGPKGGYVAPRTPVEELLAGLWAEVLGVERIGLHDDFFELGGHSLLATRVISRIRAALDAEVPLAALFETPTVAGLARAIGEQRVPTEVPLIQPSGQGGAPLSFAQERLWFLDRLEPGSATYNLPVAVRLRGELDVTALERSLGVIVSRHDALRTTFREGPSGPVQVVAPPAPFHLPVVEAGRVEEEARRPFDLEKGPVVRALLFRQCPGDHLLLVNLHHIASDGWSMGILVRELAALYTGHALPELPVQYADYARWQRSWLAGEMASELAWWREELSGLPERLDLPTDHPRRGGTEIRRGARRTVRLGRELTRKVIDLSRRKGTTPFMVVLAGFQAVLGRWANQEDVAIGSPIAGRTRVEIEDLIGFFVNTLVLRGKLRGTVGELLSRTRRTVLAAHEHQHLPFERLVEELAPVRELGRTPLFEAMLAFQTASPGAPELPGLEAEIVPVETGTAKFDLLLDLTERDSELVGWLEYDTDLFEAPTVDRLLGHFEALLSGMTAAPGEKVFDLPLLSEPESHQLLAEWNDQVSAEPDWTLLHEGFERQAERTPNAVGVVWGEERITYADLNERADELARDLRSRGAGPERIVGISLPRTPDLIVAMLAVLKSGAAYVPLDPSYPSDRTAFLIDDAGVDLLIGSPVGAVGISPGFQSRESGASPIPQSPARGDRNPSGEPLPPLTGLVEGGGLAYPGLKARANSGRPCGAFSAYLIYTSGSTGRPKGVAIEHRSAVRLVTWALETFSREELSGVLTSTSINFDLSIFEIFVPLSCGGTVILADDALALPTLPAAGEVTLLNTVPSAMAALLDLGLLPPSIRTVSLAGEPLRRALADRVYAAGVERLWNLYGPSEDTTYSTGSVVDRLPEPHPLSPSPISLPPPTVRGGTHAEPFAANSPAQPQLRPPSPGDRVGGRWERGTGGEDPRPEPPIGLPVAGSLAYVVDAFLRLQPLGVPGELCLGGGGLARGYLNRPELTAERFVPDPFGKPGGRLYRTGDRVRRRQDGALDYLGRLDRQVKIRGFRVEPGEIEAVLLAHTEVREAAVLPRDGSLVAYVVAEPETDALRAWLASRLPAPLVPSAFVRLDALPLTPNGKVDRAALARIAPILAPEAAPVLCSPIEETLAAIWSEVLGVERVGAGDSFFEIGGHSLLATRVLSRIREAFRVDLPLRSLFEEPTVSGLARRIEAAVRGPIVPIVPVPRTGALPLSFAQQRLWFLDQLEPGVPLYNIPAVLRVTGALDVPALALALAELARRHEALRTTFAALDGFPVQVIRAPSPFELPVVDLSGLAERETAALGLAAAEALRPFGLARGPVWRALCLRLGLADHMLLLTMHHIASDGWSMGILVREALALYEALLPLPELPVQYADYALWQRDRLQGHLLQSELAYWREQLSDLPALELPVDRPRPAVRSHRGGNRQVELGDELTAGLRRLARREGTTLFMTLLAGFEALLARHSGQRDFAVGTPVAGRERLEIEGLIGFFVNTLVLRGDLTGDPSFPTLLGRARETVLAAHLHQEIPFEKLVEELEPDRSPSRTPLFQVMLSLGNVPREIPETRGLRLRRIDEAAILPPLARFDLTLAIEERDGGLTGVWEHSAELFDAATIARMAGQLERLLAAVVADPGLRLSDLPLLAEAERHQLTLDWNDTAAPAAPDLLVHELFAAQAERRPEAVALRQESTVLTYGELASFSHRLARFLVRLGVGPEEPVGVCLERVPLRIAALLAVLEAGGVYLPLDPAYPRARRELMLRDAGARVLLTSKGLASLGWPVAQVIPLDKIETELAAASSGRLEAGVQPWGLAYLLYTSGSTGTPKGIGVGHAAAVDHFLTVVREYGLGPEDRVLQFGAPGFDVSLEQILPTLAAGATLVLPQSELVSPGELFSVSPESEVTVANLPTAYWQQWVGELAAGAALPAHLRLVIVGGEAMALESARVWVSLPGSERVLMLNGYGPTETIITATLFPLRRDRPGAPATVPIGRPLPRRTAWVLDRDGSLAPFGAPGELCLGGVLARGYVGRPELTAERFVPYPWGERLYRTGDLARYLPDGNLEFLGRLDEQVKIRGFRIELGEVEAVLASHPAVREAVVLAPGGRLAGFVVPVPEAAVTPSGLREHLRERLPDYMVPGAFAVLESLPLTPHGKVDRRALARLAPAPLLAGEEHAAPLGAVEEIVAALWSDVLGTSRIGRGDSFFDLGGHSLLATQLMSRVRKTLGIEIPLRALFEAPTLAGFAGRVAHEMEMGSRTAVPPIPPLPARPGESFPLSFAQQRLWFLDQLEPGSAAYNLPLAIDLTGPLDVPALERALETIALRHDALRTVFPAESGEPVQVVTELQEPVLPVIELAAREDADRLTRELAGQPFDLQRGPLLRACLVRMDREAHRLVVSMHHIVSDGWSIGVFARELSLLYTAFRAGQPSPLSELPVQVPAFAVWQRQWLSGEVLEAELAYWREQLRGLPSRLELPADRAWKRRPGASRGGLRPVALPEELGPRLRDLASAQGATLFMVLLAGFEALLGRCSGQEDFAVGTPVAGRSAAELEGLIGFFVNTLVLRADLGGEPGFRALLLKVREGVLSAQAHQHLPFEKLVEELEPARSLEHAPLFQAMLAFQNTPREPLELPGLAVHPVEVHTGTAKLDLLLSLEEIDGHIAGALEYDADRFDATTIDRLLAWYKALLAAAVATPDRPFQDLPLLSGPERHQLLAEWNNQVSTEPGWTLLHEGFERQAERTPEAVALLWGEERITYRDLNVRTDRLAEELRSRGAGLEQVVGISLPRTPDLIVAMLAVLKSGAAYVPLDPSYPPDRIAFLIDDAGVDLLIGSPAGAAGISPGFQSRESGAFPIPRSPARGDMNPSGEPLPPLTGLAEVGGLPYPGLKARANSGRPCGASSAYLIYTSGSTGRPKGVAIEHASAVRLVAWALETFSREDLAGVLASTSINFDLSIFEIFVPLSCGGTVILADDALALPNLPAARDVTLINTVPSAMAALLDLGPLPPSIRTVNLAGEPLRRPLADRVYAAGVERLWNLYGPSEDTTYSTGSLIEPGSEPAIGHPVASSLAYVVDASLRLQPLGIPGELCLGGGGLARGYLGRPELTAERFVPDPFGKPGGRLYRTGDRVRWRPDGALDYLGRLDRQVKVRGFRIELGEIESVLLACPGVAEAAVLPRDGALVAYVVAAGDTGDLRAWLAGRQPAPLVPAAFVRLDALPLTPNGKVDRAALERIAPVVESETTAAPSGPIEETLAAIWSEVLGVDRIGAGDSFFDLGGHSLLATRALARVREAFRIDLPLRDLFEAPTVHDLARRVEAALRGAETAAPPITPVLRNEDLPLSFAQQRLWLIDQLEPGSSVYNVALALRLDGPLQPEILARAFAEVVCRHEVLRTTFAVSHGDPVQVVGSPFPVPLPVLDLAGLSGSEQASEIRLQAREEGARPFDLAQGPLLRAILLRLGNEGWILLATLHHIVSDEWSLRVLFRELTALYAAFRQDLSSPLPDLPVQFVDFAVWQRRWLTGDVLETQLAYWRRRLGSDPPVLELPTDRPRPALQTFRGARLGVSLPAGASDTLQSLGRRHGATPFMTLLAAFQALLSRTSGQTDLTVGTPIAGRHRVEVEDLIGFFLNTLVVRADLSGDPGFLEIVGRARERSLEAFAHQDLPFEKLVDELKPRRSLSHPPLFQALFVLVHATRLEAESLDLRLRSLDPEVSTAKFDLTLSLVAGGEALSGVIEYNTDLFDRTTMQRMAEHLAVLCEAAARDPELSLSALPLLAAAEEHQVACEWNDTAVPDRTDVPVHRLFEASAARTPDKPAVIWDGGVWTYTELNGRASRLARRLRSLGIGPDIPVGVCADRSPELAVALLAVLKAGGAYLPVDPRYPRERQAFMLADAGAPVVLVQEALAGSLAEHAGKTVPLNEEAWSGEALEAVVPDLGPEQMCYLIYTSGSTGRPKGIALPHRTLTNLVFWQVDPDRAAATAGPARTLQFASPSFDVSLQELFSTWASGGALVLVSEDDRRDPERLAARLAEGGVERLFLPYVALQQLADVLAKPDTPLPGLRQVVTAGEQPQITPPLAEAFRRIGGTTLHNQYGPSETHVATELVMEGDPAGWPALPPIGRPVANARAYILDRTLRPAPVGVPGELVLGGLLPARGYLGRPDLTAEKLIPDPWSGEPGARAYRTGDLSRVRPDGVLEFLGRIDFQVKLRGFRIELGEIEVVLAAHPKVRESAVAVREDRPGDRRLVAYFVADEEVAAAELRDSLRERLPEHMVPSIFVRLDALPLTPSGKVQRSALPTPEALRTESVPYVEPRTALERTISAVLREVLGVDRVGLDDNFFDLGSHSLLMIRAAADLSEKLGRKVPVLDLFRAPTVASLARHLAAEGDVLPALDQLEQRAETRRQSLGRRRELRQGRAKN